MDALSIGLLVATLALLSAGQLLFKVAAQGLEFNQPKTFLTLPMGAALAAYALATLAWLGVLTRVPLSVAFPYYGITFLLVPLLAQWVLGEKVGVATYVGGAVILAGIAITAHGLRR
jgi:drug/metabolite transporter (DMT)-like permease